MAVESQVGFHIVRAADHRKLAGGGWGGGAGRGVAYGSELGVKHHHLIFTHHSFIYTVMAENYTGLKNPGH